MSQSPTKAKEDKPDSAYQQAWHALGRRILQGRSWSGRERHCAFLNTGGRRFATASFAAGVDFAEDGRGLALVDWDHDGDLDLWISHRSAPRARFLRNGLSSGSHHLALRLVGNRCNRDAIGARVEVIAQRADGRSEPPMIKTLRAGEGFLSQSSKWLHFGLGQATAVQRVRVRWPGGAAEDFVGTSVDGRFVLNQGSGQSKPAQVRSGPFNLKPQKLVLPKVSGRTRTWLAAPVPAPLVPYTDLAGQKQRLADKPGGAVLINLWSRWCKPCMKELAAFAAARGQLESEKIKVMALNVDTVSMQDKDSPDLPALRKALEQVGYTMVAGTLDARGFAKIEMIQRMLITDRKALPLPTSMLVDGDGKLRAIYRGPVEVEQVRVDARNLNADPERSRQLAAAFPGRWTSALPVAMVAPMGWALLQAGHTEDAQRMYEYAVTVDPDDISAHNNLGIMYGRQGLSERAISQFQHTLRIKPNHGEAHHNLGNLYARLQRLPESLQHYQMAVRAMPDNPSIRNTLGVTLARFGRFEEALVHFEKVVEIAPDMQAAIDNVKRVKQDLAKKRAKP